MPDYEPPIRLGLSDPRMDSIPPVEELQFQRAEPLDGAAPVTLTCLACRQAIAGEFFKVQGQPVCSMCSQRIRLGQQGRPSIPLLRPLLYGFGAALAGCALYATVAIVTGLRIGLIALVIGVMVGKAVRYGSNGRGSRRLQILAVTLTYLSITASQIPIIIHRQMTSGTSTRQAGQSRNPDSVSTDKPEREISPVVMLLTVVALIAAAPFLTLFYNPLSGLLSLVIIFIALQQAWRLTGQPKILMSGPFQPSEAHAG